METWRQLSDSSKESLKKILIASGLFLAGLRTGLIQPLVSMSFGLIQTAFSGMMFLSSGARAVSSLILLAIKPAWSAASLAFGGIKTVALASFKAISAGLNHLFPQIMAKMAALKLMPGIMGGIIGYGVTKGGYLAGRILGEYRTPNLAEKNRLAEQIKNDEALLDDNTILPNGNPRYDEIARKGARSRLFENREKLSDLMDKPSSMKRRLQLFKEDIVEPMKVVSDALSSAMSSAFQKGVDSLKEKADPVLDALRKKMDGVLSGTFHVSSGEFKKLLADLKEAYARTKGFEWMKAPVVPDIRKKMKTREALDDVRQIFTYTKRGIYARFLPFMGSANRPKSPGGDLPPSEPERKRNPEAAGAAMKSAENRIIQNTSFRRKIGEVTGKILENPFERQYREDMRTIAASGVKPEKINGDSRPGIGPLQSRLTPFVPPFVAHLLPPTPNLNFRLPDPAQAVSNAMTPKPEQKEEVKAPKEIVSGIGVANGYLREIKDGIGKISQTAPVWG
jgi:hypothetical protein